MELTSSRPQPWQPLSLIWIVAGLSLMAWAIHGALHFPVYPHALAAGLGCYILLGLIYPGLWLIVVPAALPILTLTLWSGRPFVTELDYLLAASLGFALIRHGATVRGIDRHLALVTLVFLGYNLWVTANGFYPIEPGGLGAWNDLLSSYSALREGKGPLWALAFLPVLAAHRRNDVPVQRLFAWGMLAGVVTVSATLVWERWLFTGLLDTTTPYRVSGLFFNMVTGGAAIDAYLALTAPFVAFLVFQTRHHSLQWLGLAMAALVAYCFFVTYSRTNYLAGAFITITLLGGLLVIQLVRYAGSLRARDIVAALGAAAVVLALLVGAASQGYIGERFKTVFQDLEQRLAHWDNAIGLLESKDGAWLTGVGRGLFPLETYWQHAVGEPLTAPTRTVGAEGTFISFRPGTDDGSVFLRQRIPAPADGHFRLQMDLRAPDGNRERVLVEFCARHILRFRDECQWRGLNIPAGTTEWKRFNTPVDLTAFRSEGQGAFRRPVDIAVMNRGVKSRIDVARTQLYRNDGTPVLANPDFESGMDRWFFSYGNHLRWHIKNVVVHVLVEGGVIGLAIFGWILIGALVRLGKRVAQAQDTVALCMIAALAGTLVVGMFDSLFDAPRIGFLMTLLLLLAWLRTESATRPLPSSSPAAGE